MNTNQLTVKKTFTATCIAILLSISLVLPVACKISLVAPYDAGIKTQIIDTQQKIDHLYISLADTKESERTYQKYATEYIEIEVALNSLLKQNQVKALNEHSTAVCKIALIFWRKYKNEHKTDTLISNGLIKINNKYMSDILYAMQISEEGKKLAETNKELIKE